MPSYVVFGVFLRAAHVIKGETQLSKIKAVFCPSHLRKKKKKRKRKERSGKQNSGLRNQEANLKENSNSSNYAI